MGIKEEVLAMIIKCDKGLSKYVLKKIVEYMESVSFAAGQLVG